MSYTDEQGLVIGTKNKTMLVSASAGSGKTFVVIERIIKRIIEGQDVSRLLVLTFTNAAATELKERLISKLYDVQQEYLSQGKKEEALYIAKQISKVPMADVSTIHAFCLNVIRNNFYSLGLDPMITTLDATKAAIMLNETIIEVVEEEYENAKQEFLDVLDIMGSEDNLINTLYMLYNAYKKVVNSKEWIENACNMYKADKDVDLTNTKFGKVVMDSVIEKLLVLKLDLENVIDKIGEDKEFLSRKEMLCEILKKLDTACTLTTYNELYYYMPELLNMPRLPSSKVLDEDLNNLIKITKTRITDELKQIAPIVYKDSLGVIEELNSSLKYMNWYKDIVLKIDEKYTSLKNEKCAIDFADYEHLALKALDDENVALKYKEKYDEIYIDEYQDTSNAQEAIIKKIAKNNNVVMVGDVKQSIYGFRNAKPDLFMDKYNRLEKIENLNFDKDQGKIILAKNFRSRKEVLDSTNDIFRALMSPNFGGIKYEGVEELVYADGYPEVKDDRYKTEINLIETKNETIENTEENEIEKMTDIAIESTAVAKKINEIIASKFQVYDLKKNEYRDIEYKDIVILLRTVESKANIVSEILSKYNIPSYADSKTGFYKSDEINLIIAFMKLLDNPLDDISCVSVMYSIIGKFTLDELAIIRSQNSTQNVFNTLSIVQDKLDDMTLKNKINTFLELVERFKKYIKTYKISEVLIKLYNETNIYEALRLDISGKIKCANLDNFVQIIADFEKSEKAGTLYSLLKYIDVLKQKESAGDSPRLIGENENVVRIMTIHKSKGLEFPVVILMNTAAKYNEQDVKDKLQFDDELGIGIDIFVKEKSLTYPSIIKQAIKAKSKRELRSEALRLLYVACTRAKEKLIIYGTVPSVEKYTSQMYEQDMEQSKTYAYLNNSHMKCILQATLKKQDNFNVNVYSASEFAQSDVEDKEYIDRNKNRFELFLNKVRQNNIKEDNHNISKLKQDLLYNLVLDDTNKKYTVTELKQHQESNLEELKPNILEKAITSTSYGTFIHSVIEHMDFTNISYDNVYKVVLDTANALDDKNSINKTYVAKEIVGMCESLKDILQDAKDIKRELEFVLQDDLEDIIDTKFTHNALVQGVVDMYVVTKDNRHIVIDFKTDNVENYQELIERYTTQLKIYKRAIEVAYNAQVDNTYIYSFKLKKLIEV